MCAYVLPAFRANPDQIEAVGVRGGSLVNVDAGGRGIQCKVCSIGLYVAYGFGRVGTYVVYIYIYIFDWRFSFWLNGFWLKVKGLRTQVD